MNDLIERIGGCLVLGVRGAGPDSPELRADLECCAEARIGGVVLFDRDLATGGPRNIESPSQVRELTACLRESLGDGLLIMIDQEGGNVARLRKEQGFDPGVPAAEFARLPDDEQRRLAGEQAEQLTSLGINVNLAPVVDLSIAAGSAVIAGLGRSFGDGLDAVIRCARVWIEEHRKRGVASCLKHFPGHGSATGDTHRGLVDITATTQRDVELAPYRALSDEPGALVMTGHLLDRSIDPDLPASLSRAHTQGVLRDSMGFEGLVVTDSIDMGAITGRWSPGEAAAMAFTAGADLIMDGVNAPGQVRACPAVGLVAAIRGAIERAAIPDAEARFTASVRRLDALRRWLGVGV
ncbi:MAG: glycoside hydrolase family 3 protein [Phycisphaeraceae bacterium]|nr:glycoside hydrolase family 3 protein [Phycisphaeraceae bacterium]